MNTAVINVKVEPVVKREAQRVAKDLGLSLSALVCGLLKQVVRTKTVMFSAANEVPTEYMLNALRESEDDIKVGRVSPTFRDVDDAISWLENPKRKYADQVQQKVRKTAR